MVLRRAIILATLAFCALQFCPTAIALYPTANLSAQSGDESNFTLAGKITEKHGAKLTVSTGDNIIFHVVYNDKTVIKKKDGSSATGQDLHTGMKISAAGDLAESGEITAKTIEIEQ